MCNRNTHIFFFMLNIVGFRYTVYRCYKRTCLQYFKTYCKHKPFDNLPPFLKMCILKCCWHQTSPGNVHSLVTANWEKNKNTLLSIELTEEINSNEEHWNLQNVTRFQASGTLKNRMPFSRFFWLPVMSMVLKRSEKNGRPIEASNLWWCTGLKLYAAM